MAFLIIVMHRWNRCSWGSSSIYSRSFCLFLVKWVAEPIQMGYVLTHENKQEGFILRENNKAKCLAMPWWKVPNQKKRVYRVAYLKMPVCDDAEFCQVTPIPQPFIAKSATSMCEISLLPSLPTKQQLYTKGLIKIFHLLSVVIDMEMFRKLASFNHHFSLDFLHKSQVYVGGWVY